jgi:two-component sensor histidine kinase
MLRSWVAAITRRQRAAANRRHSAARRTQIAVRKAPLAASGWPSAGREASVDPWSRGATAPRSGIPFARGATLQAVSVLIRRWKFWALVVGLWAIPSLIGALVYYLRMSPTSYPVSLRFAILYQVAAWYPWVGLTPLVLAMGRRFSLERSSPWLALPVHVVAGLVVGACHLAVALASMRALAPEPLERSFATAYLDWMLPTYLEFTVLIYFAILGLVYAVEYYRRYVSGAVHASQLEVELARAQLLALRTQLQPHFLFNTLHAISSLMDEDVRAARRMIARLADLLRTTLDTGDQQEVTLLRELETLQLYLDIERERFSDRLRVDLEIRPDALEARVPNLLLQPLVENAIRHGIAPRQQGGCVTVSASRDNGRLLLRVEDDGAGPRNGDLQPEGVGLRNTRARLERMYPESHELTIEQPSTGGFRVRIEIPFSVTLADNGAAAAGGRP